MSQLQKDLPLVARRQKAKLLLLRRFLMRRSTCKPKLQGPFLTMGEVKVTWIMSENKFAIKNGESFETFLQKYRSSVKDLEEFMEQQHSNKNGQDGEVMGRRVD